MAERTVLVGDVVAVMEQLAPPRLAQSWDNVGLLLGARDERVPGVVGLTIDLTDEVVREAERRGVGVMIAYHPPIFGKVSRVTGDDPLGGAVLRAARAGMAVFSPHTALDAAALGMGDWLANIAVSEDAVRVRQPLRACAPLVPEGEEPRVKVVTFVPTAAVDQVREAMGGAGAGVIGAYSACSFTALGEGTFRGGPGSSPQVGKAGRLEKVMESRVEMVCARSALVRVLAGLRAVHPYEEPAIDVLALQEANHPARAGMAGSGRVGEFRGRGMTLSALAARVKRRLGVLSVEVVEARQSARGGRGARVQRVAVCPGAGESLIDAALSAGCQALLTGEMKHHEQLRCARLGLGVILAGHTQTERGYLPHLRWRLARGLAEAGCAARIVMMSADRPPGRRV